MPKPKLSQLEMLIAVADTGGFGAAAVQLGCTQSRISHAITTLEASLGARLLTRSRNGCAPTEAGHGVLAKARKIVRLADSLADFADRPAEIVGRVRIACFRSISTHVLPHALEALAAAAPGIRIDIDDGCEEREDVTHAVETGRAGIGVAHLPVSQGLVAHSYVADTYALVAPASLPLRAPISWAQFDGLPYLQLDCSGARSILEPCRAAGFSAEPSRTLATDTGITAMVRHGIGYSILPRLAVFPVPDGVQVVDLPIPAKRAFALIALPDIARLKAVQIVMQGLRDQRVVARGDAFRAGRVGW
ncbi:LysR family transcriptional regulator [Burkholderia alba]|uniref:LysR family transcriptional regulator n=1 Tax=Burkholderia alba TaxID=2683677 RepID=UPI002B0604ED|nr:LysR family transcriptional regulator [Burkholderia alba]